MNKVAEAQLGSTELNYIKALDGLRALAVISVIGIHSGIIGWGWLGVQAFFVLSGYLITKNLIYLKEKFSFKEALKKFYIRRTLRIFPLYYLYVILGIVVSALILNDNSYQQKLVYLFTYTFNYLRLSVNWHHSTIFTHLWSLCVEEQFYLIWPFVILLVKKKHIKYAIFSFILLSPVVRFCLHDYLMNNTSLSALNISHGINFFTASHLDAFAMGAFINILPVKYLQKNYKILLLAGTALFLSYGLTNFFIDGGKITYYIYNIGFVFADESHYRHVTSYTVANIFFLTIILFVLFDSKSAKPTIITKILNMGPLVAIGKYSYGIYIYHWAIIYYVVSPFVSNIFLVFIVSVCLTYIVAFASYKLFEAKFLNLKDKLAKY